MEQTERVLSIQKRLLTVYAAVSLPIVTMNWQELTKFINSTIYPIGTCLFLDYSMCV
jgi:hypothetical protein